MTMKTETRNRLIINADGAKIDADILDELVTNIIGGNLSDLEDAMRLAEQVRTHVNAVIRELRGLITLPT